MGYTIIYGPNSNFKNNFVRKLGGHEPNCTVLDNSERSFEQNWTVKRGGHIKVDNPKIIRWTFLDRTFSSVNYEKNRS